VTATKPESRTRRRTGWWLIDFYRSDVGKKWAMALSGIFLLGFVLFHLAGNLKVYIGADEINEYGESLRDLGGHLVPRTHLLWIFRLGLILAFAVHIHAAFVLTLRNRRARPVGYESPRDYIVANYASRTMIWSGIIVLLFIVFHLADLTWGTTNPDFFRGDVYGNLVASFERWPVALFYIVANLALGLHIYHGAWSLFQSIGASSPRFNDWRRWFAMAFALVIVIGNLSFPIAVQIGVID
jgi:succinate dehydrogenase / fumarate reductase cytochrome b subunit